MKKVLILGIAAGLMLAACAAYAAPTLVGPTGNGVLPTAMVASIGTIEVAADYIDTDVDATYAIRALAGIGNGLELGAAYLTQNSDDAWSVNAKFAIPVATIAGFAPAVGALYLSDDPNELTEVYLVGTNSIELGEGMTALNTTLGVNYVDADGTTAIRGFIGVETTIAEKLSISAEYQTKDSDIETDALYAITARYPFTSMITGQVGYTNGVIGGGSDGNLFAGVNIKFGIPTE